MRIMLKWSLKSGYQGVNFIQLGHVWVKIGKNGEVFWTRLFKGP
jgi:hypothetical protein